MMVENDHEQHALRDEEEDQDSLLRRRITSGGQLGLRRAAEEYDRSAKLIGLVETRGGGVRPDGSLDVRSVHLNK